MSSAAAPIDVACFGGAHIDLIAKAGQPIVMASSNPGVVAVELGGVALNVARALNNLNLNVALVGSLGDDGDGHMISSTLSAEGVDVSRLHQSGDFATGRYVAIENSDGELAVAVSDTQALDNFDEGHLEAALTAYAGAGVWFADANLGRSLLRRLAGHADRPRLAVDAVSVAKSPRLREFLADFDILFCNVAEAQALLGASFGSALEAASALAAARVQACVVTDGTRSVALYDGVRCDELDVPPAAVKSVTGAGDTLVAGAVHALLSGQGLIDAAKSGIIAARKKITS
jgi:pseudouridine kinase